MRVAVLVDSYPEVSETFVVNEVRGLRAAGVDVRVEALVHAQSPAEDAEPAAFMADDGTRRRLLDLGWLVARHPVGCLADLLARRRWRREERVWPLRALAPAARRIAASRDEHLHAHFAAGAALCAWRLSRLLGVSWSFTAHGYDIFQTPRNLAAKLAAANLATSGSEYTVAHLRRLSPGANLHVVVMGVDPAAWTPSPPPGQRRVASIGRLVEKKGFEDLIDATAVMRDRGAAPAAVTIVGDGPLRETLAARVRSLGLEGVVELAGARQPRDLPRVLAAADVFCLPCVVAGDGDRDSMPVVAKEALAMGRPVVATDEVAFPELIRPAFGRLVPPRDSEALADALQELLTLPAAELAAMGEAGRAHVAEHANLWTESERLAELLGGVSGPVRVVHDVAH